MIVLSLISNVLLLEEAAAEKNPGTFFSKGNLPVDVGGIGFKPGPVKLTTGFVTKRNIRQFYPHATKDVVSKVTSVKWRLFARKCPHYNL